MATLAVAAAVNIAVALALNALFPPPDVQQTGPRLSDLGFTGASYGKFINITFGTDRVDGVIIDTQDPAIEEVVHKESQGGGLFKGGGPAVKTTTYEYFLTCRILLGIEGAQALSRLWADGKIIYDRVGASDTAMAGLEVTFYPGGQDQDIDPEEESRRGSQIPAYTHLTTIKIDRMPLANFGNRIPNFTAEISYNASASVSFENIDRVPSGFSAPGGGETEYMYYDSYRGQVIGLVQGQGFTMSKNMVFDTKLAFNGPSNGSNFGYVDGYGFGPQSVSNSSPLEVHDTDTAQIVATLGGTSVSLTDSIGGERFGSIGSWAGLQCTLPTMGLIRHNMAHGNGYAGTSGNGAWVDLESTLDGLTFSDCVLTTFGQSFFPANNPMGQGSVTSGGMWIPNPFEENTYSDLPCFGVMYWFGPDGDNNQYVLAKVQPTYSISINPITQGVSVTQGVPSVTLVRTFTRGTYGTDDFGGTGAPTGWAVNTANGDLMICNGSSIILYNPIDDEIKATKSSGKLAGRYNYYSSSTIGIATSGSALVVDTRTLATISSVDLNDVNWTPDNSTIAGASCVWDDVAQALYLSRAGSGATGANLIAKLYLNRLSTSGVGLDFINKSLATSYQRYEMAGLTDADVDVTPLASDTVLGYTINRDSTMRDAIQPLRTRFFYDVVQSDWIIKFPKRGQSAIVTVPEEFVGELKKGRSLSDDPPVKETRQDDGEIPMRVNVRYKNYDMDYDVDVEHDKRYVHQNPTMHSLDEQTIDIPMVDQPTNMKQTAQKWLWTFWNERVQYSTVLPWTYLKLDPTDVFNMGVFGETVQLRLGELDLGAEYSLGINGIVEDTLAFSSTLAGGTPLGFVTKHINSSLPTRLFFLDAPLLSIADLTTASVSAAYVAFGAYEDGWPGAIAFQSPDNTTWTSRSVANMEAATAKVVTPPGTWGFVTNGTVGESIGDFHNRFQEVAEGGTMVVNPLRRDEVWSSATEEDVLNGANILAVITSAGVEIIQYVDVTVNDNGSITLDRLLRGRLGTEDISDADAMDISDEIVLLADYAGTQQVDTISKNSLLTSELNIYYYYKGVTAGGLLEDAALRSFSYTGRDIMPYSIVHATAADDGSGGKDITWERRARGPLAAEWVDGIGTVPLNEGSEEYVARLYDDTHTLSLTKSGITDTMANFSAAELFSANPPATVEIAQVSSTGIESPITPSSTVQVSEVGIGLLTDFSDFHTGGAVTTYNLALPALTAPAAYQVGDVVVAGLFMSRAANGSPGTITSDNSDFTSIGERNQDTILIPMGINTSLWYRVLTQTDIDTGTFDYAWSWSNATYPAIGYMVFRFADTGGTLFETAATDGSDNSTSVSLASINASVINTFGVYGIAVRATTSSGLNSAFPLSVSPSGFVTAEQMWDNDQGGTVRYRYYLGYKKFTEAGATGTQSFTVSNGLSTSPIASVWTLMNPA